MYASIPSPISSRFLAALIDVAVLLPVAGLMVLNHIYWKSVVLLPIFAAFNILYVPVFEGLLGGTMGKLVLKLRVVKTDGRKMGLFRSFVRSGVFALSNAVSLYLWWHLYTDGTMGDVHTLRELLGVDLPSSEYRDLLGIAGIVSVVTIPLTSERRALHGFWSGTKCIKLVELD